MKQNDDKAKEILQASMPEMFMIYEIMTSQDIPIQDVMRSLYLITNIKKMTQFGKVTFTIKNGQIVNVYQEQQFLGEKELDRLNNR